LGSAVAEYKACKRNAPPQLILGLPDKFDVTGDYRFLLDRHGLIASKISDKVLAFLNANS
jgi:transketolase